MNYSSEHLPNKISEYESFRALGLSVKETLELMGFEESFTPLDDGSFMESFWDVDPCLMEHILFHIEGLTPEDVMEVALNKVKLFAPVPSMLHMDFFTIYRPYFSSINREVKPILKYFAPLEENFIISLLKEMPHLYGMPKIHMNASDDLKTFAITNWEYSSDFIQHPTDTQVELQRVLYPDGTYNHSKHEWGNLL